MPATREHLDKFGLADDKIREDLIEIAAEEGHADVLAAGLRAQGYGEFANAVEKADRAAREEGK